MASDDSRELNGLARSIDALFAEGGDAGAADAPEEEGAPPGESEAPPEAVEEGSSEDGPPPADSVDEAATAEDEAGDAGDVVWEEVPPDEPRPKVEPDPAALKAAVEQFLTSPPLSREGQARAIRDQAMALRDSGNLDALADAVERLALGAGDPADEAALAIARGILTPGVASRIAARMSTERDEIRRMEYFRVCARMGHEMALAVADALSDTTDRFARRTFLDAMVVMGEAAMDVVEGMVDDSRWFVVRNAVAILGEVGGKRAVELITTSLAHPDARVRREALLALAKVGGEDAGMLVYGMIEDSDADVRLAAAMAAGALKVERALKPLLALLDAEDDPSVTVGVLQALGQLGDPGAVPAIEKRAVPGFFSRPPVEVRIAAYRALHNIGTPHARELLEKATEDKDPQVRSAVRQILAGR